MGPPEQGPKTATAQKIQKEAKNGRLRPWTLNLFSSATIFQRITEHIIIITKITCNHNSRTPGMNLWPQFWTTLPISTTLSMISVRIHECRMTGCCCPKWFGETEEETNNHGWFLYLHSLRWCRVNEQIGILTKVYIIKSCSRTKYCSPLGYLP